MAVESPMYGQRGSDFSPPPIPPYRSSNARAADSQVESYLERAPVGKPGGPHVFLVDEYGVRRSVAAARMLEAWYGRDASNANRNARVEVALSRKGHSSGVPRVKLGFGLQQFHAAEVLKSFYYF